MSFANCLLTNISTYTLPSLQAQPSSGPRPSSRFSSQGVEPSLVLASGLLYKLEPSLVLAHGLLDDRLRLCTRFGPMQTTTGTRAERIFCETGTRVERIFCIRARLTLGAGRTRLNDRCSGFRIDPCKSRLDFAIHPCSAWGEGIRLNHG